MSDAPPAKVARGAPSRRIGDQGPMGRILIRGEQGHEIIPELAPIVGEPVIDKPGKGAFYQTDLEFMRGNLGVATRLVCGVTTEVCVHTTVREANDRGYCCIAVADCCASYFPEFHEVGLRMIAARGGIFGWVAASVSILSALASAAGSAPASAFGAAGGRAHEDARAGRPRGGQRGRRADLWRAAGKPVKSS
jgi:nicotinamidase-related amidase